MLFSKRKGYTPVKNSIQKESMDEALRHGLWNALHMNIWKHIKYGRDPYGQYSNPADKYLYPLFRQYWHSLFQRPLDKLPDRLDKAHSIVRKHYFDCTWYEVYDFIEFTAQHCPSKFQEGFVNSCNYILEKELSAYRFVDSYLTDITSEEEIDSIESAIEDSSKYSGVNDHLKTALSFLSDRKSPDYRNSVKESISAVESLCKAISGEPKATLGVALKKVESAHSLHPAFRSALSNLYGFTNDSNGIRHALMEESTISYSDAKFMLVASSAFINYVLGKISEND